MTLPEILSYLVIFVAVPTHWVVVFMLWRTLTEYPGLLVLRERVWTAFGLAIVVTIWAVVFLNNNLDTPILDLATTMILTRAATLSLVVPALYWLRLYR